MQVSSVDPAQASTGVYLDKVIAVTFDADVDLTSVTGQNFYLRWDSLGTVIQLTPSIGATANILLGRPVQLLDPSENYTIYLDNTILDTGANVLDADSQYQFTTGIQVTPPVIPPVDPDEDEDGEPDPVTTSIVSVRPALAELVPTMPDTNFISTITVTFDQALKNDGSNTTAMFTLAATHLFDPDGAVYVPGKDSVVVSGDQLSITLVLTQQTRDWYNNEENPDHGETINGDATFIETNVISVTVSEIKFDDDTTQGTAYTWYFITKPWPLFTYPMFLIRDSKYGFLLDGYSTIELWEELAFHSWNYARLLAVHGYSIPIIPTEALRELTKYTILQAYLQPFISESVSSGSNISKTLGDFTITKGSQQSKSALQGLNILLDGLIDDLLLEVYPVVEAASAVRGSLAAGGRRANIYRDWGKLDTSVPYEIMKLKDSYGDETGAGLYSVDEAFGLGSDIDDSVVTD